VVVRRFLLTLALCFVPAVAPAAGIALVDAGGAPHGAVVVKLSRGLVQLKITSLAPLPAAATDATGAFTATSYKAYAYASADPAVEVFLTDVYPNARQRAVRKVALGGDASRLGLDRIAVTAFSSDGQHSADVLTATLP